MTIRTAPARVPSALAATVVLLVAVTGCSSSARSDRPPDRQPASSPPALDARSLAERDAVSAYRGMWAALVEAARTSDPDAPALRMYAAGDALKLVVGGLVSNREQGKVIKGEVALAPTVSVTTPTEAAVTDCVDSTGWLEYKTSGELWDDRPGGRHRTSATVQVIDSVWKVSAFTLEGSGTC